jgi:hypothetical protein
VVSAEADDRVGEFDIPRAANRKRKPGRSPHDHRRRERSGTIVKDEMRRAMVGKHLTLGLSSSSAPSDVTTVSKAPQRQFTPHSDGGNSLYNFLHY